MQVQKRKTLRYQSQTFVGATLVVAPGTRTAFATVSGCVNTLSIAKSRATTRDRPYAIRFKIHYSLFGVRRSALKTTHLINYSPSQHLPANHNLLYLARPLAYCAQLGIAVIFFNGVILGVAVAAEYLYSFVGRAYCNF